MPYGTDEGNLIETVQVWGIDPESFGRVSEFEEILWWQALDEALATTMLPDDLRLDSDRDRLADGLAMQDQRTELGIIFGMHVSQFNERRSDGSEVRPGFWMPGNAVELTLVPVKGGRLGLEPESRRFSVVNEFQSGVFMIDKDRVLIPLEEAQEMLRLNSGILRPGWCSTRDRPAEGDRRKSGQGHQILVRAAEDVTPRPFSRSFGIPMPPSGTAARRIPRCSASHRGG